MKLCPEVVTYCDEPIDYFIWENIQPYLPKVQIVAPKKTRKFLLDKGIKTKGLPSFPKAVIMFRHATHKFPKNEIIKIGFRHGAYNFKRSTKPANYNYFNVYLTGSMNDLNEIKKIDVKTGQVVGSPKMDPIFNGKYSSKFINNLNKRLKLDVSKKTIIFTATYDKSGMSAIESWIGELKGLSRKYNILVTVHGWMSQLYIRKLKTFSYIKFIEKNENIIPYLLIADLLIGDSSSIIAEFCALNKPIITFRVNKAKRTRDEINTILEKISYQIDNPAQLGMAIDYNLKNPEEKKVERQKANNIFFYKLDGKAGERASAIIKEWIVFNSESN